jgi:hypothetical protein
MKEYQLQFDDGTILVLEFSSYMEAKIYANSYESENLISCEIISEIV